jgi:hypothetical protein
VLLPNGRRRGQALPEEVLQRPERSFIDGAVSGHRQTITTQAREEARTLPLPDGGHPAAADEVEG